MRKYLPVISLFFVIICLTLISSCSKKHEVVFNALGGTCEVSELKIKNGSTVQKPKDPEKAGYAFLGWYYNNALYDFSTPVTKDISLIAQWKKTYNITINWGLDIGQEVLVIKEGDYLLNDKEVGQYKLSHFLLDGEEFDIDTPIESDLTLEAVWLQYHKVTIHLNNGEEDIVIFVKNRTSILNEHNLETPIRDGYEFIKYCKDEALTQNYNLSNNVYSDMDLYVKWLEAYKIEYELNGGTCDNLLLSYTEATGTKDLEIPKRENYYFRGWYDNPECTGTRIPKITSEFSGDLKFYAKWEEATLENAYISFLGDSITTFQNYIPFSNIQNSYFYPKYHALTVEQTWWYRTKTNLGCKLGVNNSYSGTTVMGKYGNYTGAETIQRLSYSKRGDNIHPDIMVVFMGMNDSLVGEIGEDPVLFKKSYKNMINNIYSLFPDVQLFLCTLSYETNKTNSERYEEHVENTNKFNQAIIDLANEYNLPIIDFRTAYNSKEYLCDSVHPNYNGMIALSEVATKAIQDFYESKQQ